MDAIKSFVRCTLSEFLELPDREYYARDHAELLEALTSEQWTAGNDRTPAIEAFDDYGMFEALGRFVDELAAWNRDVGEIRDQWFYDHVRDELPSNHLAVFGCTSEVVRRLDSLLSRCRRIVRRIDEKGPARPKGIPPERLSRPMTKHEAAKLLLSREGNPKAAVRWLTKCINDGTIAWEPVPNSKLGRYDLKEFPEHHRDRMKK